MTWFYKVVFPTVWIGGFALGTIVLFLKDFSSNAGPDPPPAHVKWFFLGVTVVGGTFLYRTCAALKQVTMTDDGLVISNFLGEVVVPFAELQDVTENHWLNIRPVTLHFRRTTPFGRSVIFMPQIRLYLSAHPIVTELRDASARAIRREPAKRGVLHG